MLEWTTTAGLVEAGVDAQARPSLGTNTCVQAQINVWDITSLVRIFVVLEHRNKHTLIRNLSNISQL